MKRDKKDKKLLKLDRTTVRQLEQKDLERANGGRLEDVWASVCNPTACSN